LLHAVERPLPKPPEQSESRGLAPSAGRVSAPNLYYRILAESAALVKKWPYALLPHDWGQSIVAAIAPGMIMTSGRAPRKTVLCDEAG
jgi:hypothetical protein